MTVKLLMIRDAACGLAYLHHQNIMHRFVPPLLPYCSYNSKKFMHFNFLVSANLISV